MNIKTVLFATSAIVMATSTVTYAADAIVYQEPAPIMEAAPQFNWSGAYIGGQIGYGWGKSRYSYEGESVSMKPDGFLGGIYAGYNFDTGSNFVLGVDGDITFNGVKEHSSDLDPATDTVATIESKLRWSGAVRARAGVTFDRVMPFIAGGVAFGSVKTVASLSDPTESIRASQSKTLTGWTIGGGVDYAATDNVIVRLDYRYTDYGNKDFSFNRNNIEFEGRDNFKVHDLRLGVAYKF